MTEWILVFLGGGFGALSRHGVNLAASRIAGFDFPWGTMFINITGSFLMGILAAWFAFRGAGGLTQHMRLLLTTGVLAAAFQSRQQDGKRLETPHLAIRYEPTFTWKDPPAPQPGRPLQGM